MGTSTGNREMNWVDRTQGRDVSEHRGRKNNEGNLKYSTCKSVCMYVCVYVSMHVCV